MSVEVRIVEKHGIGQLGRFLSSLCAMIGEKSNEKPFLALVSVIL